MIPIAIRSFNEA